MERIQINFKASDFVNTSYQSLSNCPLAKAAKRHFNVKHVACGGSDIDIYYSGGVQIRYLIEESFDEKTVKQFTADFIENPKAKRFIFFNSL